MEYCLVGMWRDQTAHSKLLMTISGMFVCACVCMHHTPLSELRAVLHQSHLLVSAMVHFISQLQYYITFEVSHSSPSFHFCF